MLETLRANAGALGLAVQTVAADAERLPFADASFDLVFGHAVLHHIPDLAARFAEFERVLRRAARSLFAGEPSRYGRLARARAQARPRARGAALARARAGPARARRRRTRRARTQPRGRRRRPRLRARRARRPGPRGGPRARARERRGAPGELVRLGQPHARGQRRARRRAHGCGASMPTAATCAAALDGVLLESRLPAAIFYNLMLTARKRAPSSSRLTASRGGRPCWRGLPSTNSASRRIDPRTGSGGVGSDEELSCRQALPRARGS